MQIAAGDSESIRENSYRRTHGKKEINLGIFGYNSKVEVS